MNKKIFLVYLKNNKTYSNELFNSTKRCLQNGFSNAYACKAQHTCRNTVAMRCIKLSPGSEEMPIVGLGTWRAADIDMESTVFTALEEGYKLIDTAFNYNNEAAIGNSLKKWFDSGKGTREDIFITTKLPNFGNRPKDVERFLRMSLEKLKLSYVDLYLMHMPFSFHCNESTLTPLVNEDGTFSLDLASDITETWKVMEQQVKNGLAKNIGLSNCNAEQVQRVYNSATIKPAVLQIELHAYCQQKALREFCKKLNIAVNAYSPLGSPGANTHFKTKYNYSLNEFPDILGHPVVKEISEKYNKVPGQILLKHLVQRDVIVIPKSGNPERIQNNIELFDFELSEEDLAKLDGLDKGEKGRIFDFLFFKGVENHPEYPFKDSLKS